jgi:hypothetical protein
MLLEIARHDLRHCPAAHRMPFAVHGFAVARDQIMPIGQRITIRAQAIGAAFGEPADLADVRGGQPQAVRHESAALAIVAAARGLAVEQAAGDIGGEYLAAIGILDLVEAAFAAAVAQRLPFRPVERRQRPLPEVHFTH